MPNSLLPSLDLGVKVFWTKGEGALVICVFIIIVIVVELNNAFLLYMIIPKMAHILVRLIIIFHKCRARFVRNVKLYVLYCSFKIINERRTLLLIYNFLNYLIDKLTPPLPLHIFRRIIKWGIFFGSWSIVGFIVLFDFLFYLEMSR